MRPARRAGSQPAMSATPTRKTVVPTTVDVLLSCHPLAAKLSDQLIQVKPQFGVESLFRLAATEKATAFCS